MGLESGTLSAPEYKPVVHDIVDSYIVCNDLMHVFVIY